MKLKQLSTQEFSDYDVRLAKKIIKPYIDSSHKLDMYDHKDGRSLIIVAAIKQTGMGGRGSTGAFIGQSWNQDLTKNAKLKAELQQAGFKIRIEHNCLVLSRKIK